MHLPHTNRGPCLGPRLTPTNATWSIFWLSYWNYFPNCKLYINVCWANASRVLMINLVICPPPLPPDPSKTRSWLARFKEFQATDSVARELRSISLNNQTVAVWCCLPYLGVYSLMQLVDLLIHSSLIAFYATSCWWGAGGRSPLVMTALTLNFSMPIHLSMHHNSQQHTAGFSKYL